MPVQTGQNTPPPVLHASTDRTEHTSTCITPAVGTYTDTGYICGGHIHRYSIYMWWAHTQILDIYVVGTYTDTRYICGGHIHRYSMIYMWWAHTQILDIYVVGTYTDTR